MTEETMHVHRLGVLWPNTTVQCSGKKFCSRETTSWLKKAIGFDAKSKYSTCMHYTKRTN